MTTIERRTLAPVPGGRVRKPDGAVLAEGGESVVMDTYWRRRLLHADVVEVADGDGAAAAPETAALEGDDR